MCSSFKEIHFTICVCFDDAVGCIAPLCSLLEASEPKLITVALEGLENILAAGEAQSEADGSLSNAYVSVVEDCDGVVKIENLQYHEQTGKSRVEQIRATTHK